MPEKKSLVTINIITDDDTGMYHVGEVDGILQKAQLSEFLQNYGLNGKDELLTHLAFLQYQVISEWLEMQEYSDESCNKSVSA